MKILIIANAYYTISGGDVIFVEYAKQWAKSGIDVTIATNEKGLDFCVKNGFERNNVILLKGANFDSFGVYVGNIMRSISSIVFGLKHDFKQYNIVFSASDFLPDTLIARKAKSTSRFIKWIAALYIICPSPKNPDTNKITFRRLLFYFSQSISIDFMKQYADKVVTSSEHNKQELDNTFAQKGENFVKAIRGGIDLEMINLVAKQDKAFDAIFLGRLHEQKNVDELLNIWALLASNSYYLKLAIVGTGPEEQKLKALCAKIGLQQSVTFLEESVGVEKIKLYKSAKLFVSASKHDSGNIALDEALACGLPGVCYDIPKNYYPKGVVKVPLGNKRTFADVVMFVLTNTETYDNLSIEGKAFANSLDWRIKAQETLEFIQSN